MKQYANVHLNDYDSSSCNPGTALLIFLITFKQVKAEISKEKNVTRKNWEEFMK